MSNDLICPVHGQRHYSAFAPNGECYECLSKGVHSQGTLAPVPTTYTTEATLYLGTNVEVA